MFYLCSVPRKYKVFGYENYFVFDTDDNICERVTDADLRKINSLFGKEPELGLRYGFKEYSKYRLLFGNRGTLDFLSWRIKDYNIIAGINIEDEYPRLVIQTIRSNLDNGCFEYARIIHSGNNCCTFYGDYKLENWCYIPYEMFKMFMFRENKEHIKSLLGTCELSIQSGSGGNPSNRKLIYEKSLLKDGEFLNLMR